jgi:hypothetical protein
MYFRSTAALPSLVVVLSPITIRYGNYRKLAGNPFLRRERINRVAFGS